MTTFLIFSSFYQVGSGWRGEVHLDSILDIFHRFWGPQIMSVKIYKA